MHILIAPLFFLAITMGDAYGLLDSFMIQLPAILWCDVSHHRYPQERCVWSVLWMVLVSCNRMRCFNTLGQSHVPLMFWKTPLLWSTASASVSFPGLREWWFTKVKQLGINYGWALASGKGSDCVGGIHIGHYCSSRNGDIFGGFIVHQYLDMPLFNSRRWQYHWSYEQSSWQTILHRSVHNKISLFNGLLVSILHTVHISPLDGIMQCPGPIHLSFPSGLSARCSVSNTRGMWISERRVWILRECAPLNPSSSWLKAARRLKKLALVPIMTGSCEGPWDSGHTSARWTGTLPHQCGGRERDIHYYVTLVRIAGWTEAPYG